MTLEWSSSYAPVDGDFADVSLLLKGEGTNGSTTILDSSSNNLSVTAAGDAQIINTVATPFSPTAPSDGVLAFDGTGDYLTVPNDNDFDFGSGDYTIEFFLYALSLSSFTGALSKRPTEPDFAPFMFETDGSAQPKMRFLSAVSAGPTWTIIVSPNAFPLFQWVHLAAVRLGNTLNYYENGVLKGSGAISGSLVSNTQPVSIGRSATTTSLSNRLNGYISNLRITKGVARYTENFDVPTAPFPIYSPTTRAQA